MGRGLEETSPAKGYGMAPLEEDRIRAPAEMVLDRCEAVQTLISQPGEEGEGSEVVLSGRR